MQGPALERREDLRELNGAAQEEFLDELPQNSVQPPPRPKHRDGQYRFPHGPRQLPNDFNGSSFAIKILRTDVKFFMRFFAETGSVPPLRRVRRFVAKSPSAEDVGVSGLYEVISETDLAFSVDSRPENVQVYQVRV
jgi:hypothetical protein